MLIKEIRLKEVWSPLETVNNPGPWTDPLARVVFWRDI
jgi:hypothetical protein